MARYLDLVLLSLLIMGGCDHSGLGKSSQLASIPRSQEASFYVKDGKLFDFKNFEFVIRGVNIPFAYYYHDSFKALDTAKEHKFNSVRIVWCADTLVRSGRCESKDMHSLSALAAVLEKMRRLELVAVLNLQNATGSNEPDDLAKLIDWYTRPDVVELLNSYQDMLLINLANEWYGSWEDPQDLYTQSYLREITRIRDAGLSHTLIVDARGWGQQFSSILETHEAFQRHDSNVLFSSHMYDIFKTEEVVESAFRSVRDKKIPLLIGEFGCSHYPGQEVACSSIMKNAEQSDHKYGYIAWSFSGNSSPLDGLDLFQRSDWTTLSSYGERIINTDPDGIANTSMVACLFPGHLCEGEVE